jgi:predicted deacylase
MDQIAKPTSLRIHQFAGLAPGPRLLVLGAVHGNEVCGTQAMRLLISELDAGSLAIEAGTLTLVPVVNPLAYQKSQRQGDRNLNRNLEPKSNPADFEDHVANVLCPLLAAHDVLLDLHSFHTAGAPFAMLGPPDNTGALEPFGHAAAEARLVAHLGPRRVVDGWMEAYARGVERRRDSGQAYAPALLDARYGVGTSEYMRAHGGYGVTLECGQHEDPEAPHVAYRAIRQTLALLGLARIPLEPPGSDFEKLTLVDVIDREHADDIFARQWASFDALSAGEPIGQRSDGRVITAPAEGFIVFPNPKALPGNEWFYFAKAGSRGI